jgi:hypothetical protein
MSKRAPSPDLIPNPFIKKRNLAWIIHDSSAHGDDHQRAGRQSLPANGGKEKSDMISTAAVEAGQVTISNHLEHFSTILSSHIQHSSLLSIPDYSELYKSSIGNPSGAHFVVHQHDHPIAGTHYDLRLQINETSSASWAIMYGLPGDPNSKRLNRNATETRIHCLWVSCFFNVLSFMFLGAVSLWSGQATTCEYCQDHVLTKSRSEPSCGNCIRFHWISHYMGHWDIYSAASQEQIRTYRGSGLAKLL